MPDITVRLVIELPEGALLIALLATALVCVTAICRAIIKNCK